MPIVRLTNYVEAYRVRALSPDIHRMAGRDDKNALTEFVNSRILEGMKFGLGDVLVDIGCGDGCLLRMAAGKVSRRIGVIPTREEKERLETILPDVTFLTALVQKLPLESESVSHIVCNSVLLLLDSESDVTAALQEMARVARRHGKIWIGEIPDADEYEELHMYRGTSEWDLLRHLRKNAGWRPALGMGRRLVRGFLGRESLVLNSARMFHATPERLIRMATQCGLKLETYFRHQELDLRGDIVDSAHRFDYVFGK